MELSSYAIIWIGTLQSSPLVIVCPQAIPSLYAEIFFYIPKWHPHFLLLPLHQVLSYGFAHWFSLAATWVVAIMCCNFVFPNVKICGLWILIYLVKSPLTPKGLVKSIKTKFAQIIFTSIFWKPFLNFHPFLLLYNSLKLVLSYQTLSFLIFQENFGEEPPCLLLH